MIIIIIIVIIIIFSRVLLERLPLAYGLQLIVNAIRKQSYIKNSASVERNDSVYGRRTNVVRFIGRRSPRRWRDCFILACADP